MAAQLFKWLLPGLIVLQVGLIVGGIVPPDTALLLGAVVELLLLSIIIRQGLVAMRRYRLGRSGGLSVEGSVVRGLSVFLPEKAARLVALEPRIWFYLYKWIRRKPAGAQEFGYRRRSMVGALVVVTLLTAPLEILVAELLVPWVAVRWIILVLGLYGLLWAAGLYASIQVRPYRLDTSGLWIYYGVLAEGFIPYKDVAAVDLARHAIRSRQEGLVHTPGDGGSTYIVVGGRTDVTLRLTSPALVQGLLSAGRPALTVGLAVDEPGQFVAALNRHLGSRPTPEEDQ